MKIKIYTYALAVALLIVSACEDVLDKVPLDSPSSAAFFRNQTEVDMGLFACYERIVDRIGLKGEMPWIVSLDVTTDISWNRDASPIGSLGNGTAASNNASARNAWRDFYAVIARANFRIDYIHNAEGAVS